jgi:hypothetical protein
MKQNGWKFISAIMLAVLILGVLPITAYAATPADVVIGNSYTLQSGDVLNDDLMIIGGNANLMIGSTINGTVFLLGGSLDAAGTVNGDMIIFGGTVNLAETFVLHGDLINAGAYVNKDQAAQITGQTFQADNPQNIILPGGLNLPNFTNMFSNRLSSSFDPVLRVGGFFVRLLLWALVAMVVAMFIPNHLSRASQTAMTQPFISGGLGCLTLLIVPMILIFLAITICLIPVSLIGTFLLLIAWAFGLVALGIEVGKRISAMFKKEWHPAITAGVGTLVLMLVLNGLDALIPCVGWIPKLLVGLIGLGAVLLTQFGMKPYNQNPSLPEENPEASIPAETQ